MSRWAGLEKGMVCRMGGAWRRGRSKGGARSEEVEQGRGRVQKGKVWRRAGRRGGTGSREGAGTGEGHNQEEGGSGGGSGKTRGGKEQ